MTSPSEPSQPVIGPTGFSEAQRLRALELRTRLANGEKIPLPELQAFILSSEADLRALRGEVKEKAKEKKTDVDFF